MANVYGMSAANELPIYDRAIKAYPHLAEIKTKRAFCFALCHLAAVKEIKAAEYYKVARVASGGEWEK